MVNFNNQTWLTWKSIEIPFESYEWALKEFPLIELKEEFPHAMFDGHMVLYLVSPWLSNVLVLEYLITKSGLSFNSFTWVCDG